MKWITLMIGALAVTVLVEVQPSFAYYDGAWCAYKRGSRGVSGRCDFSNYEACRAEMAAGWCTQNPHHAAVAQPRSRKIKRTLGR